MATDYTKHAWVNMQDPAFDENTDPKLNAANLNEMEAGIDTAHSELATHEADADVHLTSDQNAAIDGAASPSAANVLATIDDIVASGGGDMLKSKYDTGVANVTDVVDTADALLSGGSAKTYSNIESAIDADIATHAALTDVHHAQTHASNHTNGTDDIQDATNAVKGLATAAHITTLEAVDTAVDQSVISGASPTFDGVNITNVDADTLIVDVKEANVSAVTKGQMCAIVGSSGAKFEVQLCDCDDADLIRVLGLVAVDTAQNETGQVIYKGLLANVDTQISNTDVNPNGETWAAGDLLFVSTTAGGLTNVRPSRGRCIKAGRTLKGNSASDTLLAIVNTNDICACAAAGEDICNRMGDSIGVNKCSFKDYDNSEVAAFDSNGNLTLVGTVDGIDIATDVAANTSKVTNATHTGEVTGSTTLTVDKTSISNKGLVTAVGSDHVLIGDASDSNNLKRALVSDFASAGGDMSAATYDPTTVAGDAFDMDNMLEGVTTKILTANERTKLGAIEESADVTDDTNVGLAIHSATGESIVDSDKVPFADTVTTKVHQLNWASVKSTLKTYFDTQYNLYTHPNHTGDITSTGDGATAIAADVVTYDKMQDVSATDKLLGRSTAGAGTVEEIACTAAGRALLDDVDAAAQLVTLGLTATHTELNYTDNVTSAIQTQLNAKAASGANSDITQLSGLTTDLSIAQGGTGQSTAQTAIDALSAVSGATNEHVLTKDTVTGNAKWKIAAGGGGTITAESFSSSPAHLTTDQNAGKAFTISSFPEHAQIKKIRVRADFTAGQQSNTGSALINDGTGVAPADTSIVYDGDSPTDLFAADDQIKVDSEWMDVTAVNTGTNTLSVTRGIKGTMAAYHDDNAVITKGNHGIRIVLFKDSDKKYSKRIIELSSMMTYKGITDAAISANDDYFGLTADIQNLGNGDFLVIEDTADEVCKVQNVNHNVVSATYDYTIFVQDDLSNHAATKDVKKLIVYDLDTPYSSGAGTLYGTVFVDEKISSTVNVKVEIETDSYT